VTGAGFADEAKCSAQQICRQLSDPRPDKLEISIIDIWCGVSCCDAVSAQANGEAARCGEMLQKQQTKVCSRA
jgi:hypothetical protein